MVGVKITSVDPNMESGTRESMLRLTKTAERYLDVLHFRKAIERIQHE